MQGYLLEAQIRRQWHNGNLIIAAIAFFTVLLICIAANAKGSGHASHSHASHSGGKSTSSHGCMVFGHPCK